MDVNREVATVGKLDFEDTGFGGAFGAGFDFLNVDVKKVYVGTDVLMRGTKVSAAKADPVLCSVGLGWRL